MIEWHDAWAHLPRTAGKAVVMMVTLLNWAVENGTLRVGKPSGPPSLNSRTQSRTICSVTFPTLAASPRLPPSRIRATANSRRT